MFCGRCGNQVKEDWTCCDRCGNYLKEEQSPVQKAVNPEVNAVAPPGLKLRFAVLGNGEPQKIQEVNLGVKLTIGRVKPGSDVTFEDREVSGKHCEIFREKGMVFVKDLNSTNGTWVNGVPIKGRYRLSSGDIIAIGQTEFRIIFGE
jgi:hypothetical protein